MYSRLFAICFSALAMISCSQEKETKVQFEIKMRLPSDPPSIDWNKATDNVSQEIITPIHEGLVTSSRTLGVEPALAKSWTISPDGKTYTFKIDPAAKWSDGASVTAQQFVDSWLRLLDPKTASEYAYFIYDVEGAEAFNSGKAPAEKVGISAPDAETFVVKLKGPASYFIQVPTFWVTFPIRKELIEKFGDRWTDPENLVTAGHFKLVSQQRDSKIVVEKNSFHTKAAQNMIERITFRVVKDDSVAVTLFNSGDLDIVRDLPPIQINELAKRDDFIAHPFLRGYYYGFNIKDPAVADVRVRKAIAHAIDRQELKTILGPMITPARAWNQPGFVGYNETRGLGFDPEMAKKLWSEVKNKPAFVELWFDQKEMHRLVAENIQAQVKKHLGLELRLQNQEWKVYLKTLRNKAPAVFRLGWGADYPDPDNFFRLFTCTSGNNFTGFCNKSFDGAVDRASTLSSDAERAKLYNQAEKSLLEDEVAIVPLFNQTNMHLVSKRLKNYFANPMGYVRLNEIRIE